MRVDATTDRSLTVAIKCLFLFGLSVLAGCQNMIMGEQGRDRNPREKPTVNITTFSESLECMDDMLLAYDPEPITITAQNIPNLSGDPNTLNGAKEMLITSLSSISEKSKKIRFVSFGSDLTDILALHRGHANKDSFVTPDYFIRGAITQLDKNVVSSRIGMGLNHKEWNTAFSGGQGISYAALDLNIGTVSNLQMISGVTSHNVLAVYNKGLGGDLGGRINSVGSFFDFGVDRRDGLGQAVRNLIDLGVIEIVGRMFEVPYMVCLPIDYNRPEVAKLIEKEFERFSADKTKLVKALQYSLYRNKFYNGKIDGVLGEKTQRAIAFYQQYQGVFDKGLDLNTYKRMLYNVQPDNGGKPIDHQQAPASLAYYSESPITQVDPNKVVFKTPTRVKNLTAELEPQERVKSSEHSITPIDYETEDSGDLLFPVSVEPL